MDYKNDNRTPRDRVTGEFLSELLFTESGGECTANDCTTVSVNGIANRKDEPSSCRPMRRNTVYNTERNRTPYRNDAQNGCGCGYNTARSGGVEFRGNYSLAMAYVPMQRFEDLFEIEEGFCEGTIFKALRFPFYPTPCRKECD